MFRLTRRFNTPRGKIAAIVVALSLFAFVAIAGAFLFIEFSEFLDKNPVIPSFRLPEASRLRFDRVDIFYIIGDIKIGPTGHAAYQRTPDVRLA